MKKTRLITLILLIFSTGTVKAQSPQSQELAKLYTSQGFEKTIIRAKELLKDDPDNLDYNAFLSRALVDNGNYAEAIPVLKFVIDNDSTWRKAWSLGYLGSSCFMLSEYDNSKAALKSAFDLNITENATKYASKRLLLFGFDTFFDDWKIRETTHIRFHFQNMSDPEIETFIQSRETAYEKINNFFGSTLPKKIDVFAWQSKDDALKILRTNLGFADPQYCIVHTHFQQTKGHELTHVISNYSVKIVKKTGLINEGTSVCFDLSNNNRNEMVMNWLKANNQKIDIKDTWNNWNKYPQELTYPLSGLFVEELITKFGKEKFLTFFADQTYENAKTIYGGEIDNFIKAFEDRYNG